MTYEVGYRLNSEVARLGAYSAPYETTRVCATYDEALAEEHWLKANLTGVETRVVQCFVDARDRKTAVTR